MSSATPCAGTAGPATTRSSTSRSPTRRAGSACGSATRCSRRSTAPAECALWLVAMAPDGDRFARKATFPATELDAATDPFRADARRGRPQRPRRGAATSTRRRVGAVVGAAPAALRVRPPAPRARRGRQDRARPPARRPRDLAGPCRLGERACSSSTAPAAARPTCGAPRHAARWAWTHCNDLRGADGAPRPDTFVDAVSVYVERLGRELGPSTPVVGRFRGEDFAATDPVALVRARSRFGLSTWRFEARDGRAADRRRGRRAAGDARRRHLPRPRRRARPTATTARWPRCGSPSGTAPPAGALGWTLRDALVADGRAHFEYGQRAVRGRTSTCCSDRDERVMCVDRGRVATSCGSAAR